MEAILVYLGIAVAVTYIVLKENRLAKKIADGFKPDAKDGDKDGIVQENTKWERKAKKKK